MPKSVLSPCGTSLLTNNADIDNRRLLLETANMSEQQCDNQAVEALSQWSERVRERLLTADLNEIRKMSAELNGLISFYDGQMPSREDIQYLLITDTFQGELVYKLISEWFEAKNLPIPQKVSIRGLKTSSITEFRIALSDIVKWMYDTWPIDANQYVAFNLTGGFKSILGFLQTLATVRGFECVYIFEQSAELLRIPQLPVQMNPSEIIANNIPLFRRLQWGSPVSAADCAELPGTLLNIIDNEGTLSEWGFMLWQQIKRDLYEKQLHELPDQRIHITDNFRRKFSGLEAKRKREVNEKLDDLWRYFNSGRDRHLNTRSLDFKELLGNPCPPSTHECDAWHDRGAWRIFGHFEDETFVLDNLARGLGH